LGLLLTIYYRAKEGSRKANRSAKTTKLKETNALMESVFYKVAYTIYQTQENKHTRMIEVPSGTEPEDIGEVIMDRVRKTHGFDIVKNDRKVSTYGNGKEIVEKLRSVDWKLAPLTKWVVNAAVSTQPQYTDCSYNVLAADENHARELVDQQVYDQGADYFFDNCRYWEFDEVDCTAEKGTFDDDEIGQVY